MRIAVLIIGLCLTGIVGLQSCTVTLGDHLARNGSGGGGGGAVGLLIAFLFVLGSAFALGLPRISAALFLVAGLLGISVGSTTDFHDLRVWGGVALALAIMAYFGSRELRRRNRSLTDGTAAR